MQDLDLPVWGMLSTLKKMVSWGYDDRPMSDGVYEFHARWIKLLHDYYLRVEHAGHVKECLEIARKEHVILISNHAITLEAALLGYFLLKEEAGKMGTSIPRPLNFPWFVSFSEAATACRSPSIGELKPSSNDMSWYFPREWTLSAASSTPTAFPVFTRVF
jgi:hypothetical protein